MATIEEIKQELNDAKEEYRKAVEQLEKFEEGEDDGKWLNELRGKARRKALDEEDKEEKKKLEEEKKSLEESKKRWEGQVINLQNKLTEFEEKGNEQIA